MILGAALFFQLAYSHIPQGLSFGLRLGWVDFDSTWPKITKRRGSPREFPLLMVKKFGSYNTVAWGRGRPLIILHRKGKRLLVGLALAPR